MLKKQISSQIQHIIGNLPDANNIHFDFKFISDKSQFEKAVYDYFGCFMFNSQVTLAEQQQQIQNQKFTFCEPTTTKLTNVCTAAQFNSPSDEIIQHSALPLDQDWLINLGIDSQTSTVVNSANMFNDHHNSASPPSKWRMNSIPIGHRLNDFNNLAFEDHHHSPIESPPTEYDCMSLNMANLAKTQSSLNSNQRMMGNRFSQRPSSPIDTYLMMNGHQQHQNGISNVNSRSETPATNNLDDFSQVSSSFNGSSMTSQNLMQLTKLANTAPLSIASNSPPLQDPNQAFAGNGNLNPPVRTVKMTHMQIRTKFGSLGPAKSQFHSPHGFCLGVDEEIIVADTNNHRIQIFDKNGEYKSHFGLPGREEGQLWYPRKVTVMRASGKFVVCDRGSERSRMQIFSKTGHFIKKIAIRYIDIVAGLAITSQGVYFVEIYRFYLIFKVSLI